MAENKKFGVISIIVSVALGVALLMGIVGLCLDWLTVSMMGLSSSGKIGDIADGEAGYQAVEAFAIIAVLAAAGTLALYVTGKFVDKPALKKVTLALAVLLIVSALLTLILTYVVRPEGSDMIPVSVSYSAAVGCWLLSVFGLLGGVAGVVGAVKG